jgi:hypothetical protein
MASKKFKVHFTTTTLGNQAQSIDTALANAVQMYGANLPAKNLDGDEFQFRELVKVGSVWTGVFARLRIDAPHIVDASDREREIDLEAGDRIVDKCHFIYRAASNILIWQVNKTAGGLSKAQAYLSQIFQNYVDLPQIMNEDDIDRVLAGQLYEVTFGYARPESLTEKAPTWNQNAFNMMSDVHAAQAKFMLRAPRGGGLAKSAKQMVKELLGGDGIGKIRVRLTDESDPIELFMAPLHDSVQIAMLGQYPNAREIYVALEAAFDRQKNKISNVVQTVIS